MSLVSFTIIEWVHDSASSIGAKYILYIVLITKAGC